MFLADAAAAIRDGWLDPVDVFEQCLERIRAYEDQIHAWVLVDEDAAKQTAAQRGREAARGEIRGPLHGIPLGIKDIIDVEGLPTRAGSPLRADHVAQADAPLVVALRRAGAVILGKTVTVQFACFDPSPTRNPWNPRAHARRIQQRIGRGPGHGYVPRGPRHPNRRLPGPAIHTIAASQRANRPSGRLLDRRRRAREPSPRSSRARWPTRSPTWPSCWPVCSAVTSHTAWTSRNHRGWECSSV